MTNGNVKRLNSNKDFTLVKSGKVAKVPFVCKSALESAVFQGLRALKDFFCIESWNKDRRSDAWPALV